MSISIQTNTSIKSSNSSANSESSQISQILKKIQSLTEKLGKVSSEDGMTTDIEERDGGYHTKANSKFVCSITTVTKTAG